jgi:predicted amidohydrolase
MKVGFVQSSPVFGEKHENFDAVCRLLNGYRADLLVLPELFATGYAFTSADEVKELAENTEGETMEFARQLSATTGAAIVAGFIERENDSYYNASLLADESGLITTYRKIHLFNKEKFWFSPGNRPPEPVTVRGVKIGMMICFDWIFPETCRSLALKGADIIAHPANLVLPWAQQAMITRCIENHIFAVTANRIGREQRGDDDFTFTGQSRITGCKGEVLASAPENEACVMSVEIDPAIARDKSVNPYNDLLKDRRNEFYSV